MVDVLEMNDEEFIKWMYEMISEEFGWNEDLEKRYKRLIHNLK